MSSTKVYLLLYIFVTWIVFVLFWNARSGILFDRHRHDISITSTHFADVEPLSGKRGSTNHTYVLDIQEKVNTVMKRWQTVQVFRENVDFSDMIYRAKYTDIEKSKAILQTDWFEQRAKSCALVGNSGILLNSGCGDVIDESDLVIRMNLAAFGHVYSSAVGSKVTVMTINHLQIKKLKSCFMNVTEDEKSRVLKQIHTSCSTLITRLQLLKNDSVIMPARGYFQELVDVLPILRKRFHLNFKVSYNPKDPIIVSKRLWHFDSPSTGLGLYTVATQLCEEITLFGFFPFHQDQYNRTILHHYYEPEIKINYESNCHSMPDEYKFLLDLERKGAIRMINNCTSL